MKILELNKSFYPGGAERFIVDLSNELAKIEENDVYVCTYADERNPRNSFYRSQVDKKVEIINIPCYGHLFSKIKLVFSIYRLIRNLKPDVVHCHLSSFNFIVLPALLNHKPFYVNTLHNLAEKNIKPGLDKFIKKIMYRAGVKPVTISPLCYKSFTDYMGFNTSVMIENGCREIQKTSKFNDVINEIESYKFSKNTKVFINVARMHPQKNHQLLIESFNRLIDRGFDAILLIIGSLDVDSTYTKKVMKSNHTDRVHFLGTKENVPDYLFASDAFCLSSLWEGAPISLLEAGFAGCYPLCTPVGGCKDTIINNEWGMLSKDLSVESYTEMLQEYMEQQFYDRNRISNLYKGKYLMKECATKYQNLFKNYIQSHHGKEF